MLTQQCHPDRAKRRGIFSNNIRDISRSLPLAPLGGELRFDMTSTRF